MYDCESAQHVTIRVIIYMTSEGRKRMIRNVIFDIGQVLKGWHPERISAMFEPDVAKAVYDAVFTSGHWVEMDLGVEDDEAVFEKMIAKAPQYKKEILYFLDHLLEVSERFDYSIPWISQLKELGYRVYFLSNYSRHLRKTVPQTIDFLPYLDGGIFSSDVKLMKPDPKIYGLLCDTYGLVPQECLFIDDSQANVDGAIAFGMKAVRFDGYEKSYDEVMTLLQEETEL